MPTERRRPRRACASRAVDTRARRVVCAVCRVTSLRLLLSASHRRFENSRLCQLCVASPVENSRLCQSRHRRRRASAEPRPSRFSDRAPPTSSCVRRPCRRHTRAPCRVRRVSSDITAPLALHRRFGSVRADTGGAERAPSRERVVVPSKRRRPRRACANRAVDTRARRLFALHRRFGSVRADTGDAERAPSRERVVVPTERRRPRRACADRAVDTRERRVVCAVCRVLTTATAAHTAANTDGTAAALATAEANSAARALGRLAVDERRAAAARVASALAELRA